MAQKKSKKHRSTFGKHTHPLDRMYRDALSHAGRRGSITKLLNIHDPTFLPMIEADLDDTSRDLMMMFCCADIRKLPDIDNHNPIVSRSIMQTDSDTVANTFATMCASLIASILTPSTPDLYDKEQVYHLLGKFESKIPDNLYEMDGSRQCQKHLIYQFLDGLSNGVSDLIDWSELMQGTNPCKWAENTVNMIQTIFTEDELKTCEEHRLQILKTYFEMLKKQLPEFIRQAKKRMLAMGFDPEPQLAVKTQSAAAKPILDQLPTIMNIINQQPSYATHLSMFEIPRAMEPGEPWMLGLMTMLEYLELDNLNQIHDTLLQTYSANDLTYASLVELAAAAHTNRFTCISEFFLMNLILIKFTSEKLHEMITPTSSDQAMHWNTFQPIPCPKRIKLICEEASKQDNSAVPSNLSLWQILAANTNQIPPETLYIRTDLDSLLQEIGFDPVQSAAICGYIEGAKAGRTHSMMAQVYVKSLLKNIENLSKSADTDQPDQQDPRTILEQEISQITADAESRINAAHQKVMKTEQAARHDAAKAAEQIEKLKAELIKKQELIKSLTRENEELQEILQACDLPSDDTEESSDTDLDISYPCLIGKTIKIVSFGGSDNWLAEMRSRFPNVRFFPCDTDPNEATIAGADIILVNTWTFKHKRFWRIQSVVRKTGQTVQIFPKKGLNACSQHLINTYDTFCRNNPDKARKDNPYAGI